jgi:hypothetical protein
MQGLPVGDWQFWVVSLLALVSAAAVFRTVLPRKKRDSAACRGCPTAEGGEGADGASKPKRVELTIGGKRVRGS